MKDSAAACFEPVEVQEGMMRLVQNCREVAEILELEIPPECYYEELHTILAAKFKGADPDLVEHAVSLIHAFDTATAFALSFGIAKFQLAQWKVKLVGEIVGREGRSPNPAITRAIRNWPPIRVLKDLQGFLGTANYVRAHAGPAYARVAAPLSALLLPSLRTRSSSQPSKP